MSEKHTPGPWIAIKDTVYEGSKDSSGDEIVTLEYRRAAGGPHPRNIADARLIAAAPELLKALRRARDELEKHDGYDPEDEDDRWIYDAISKAEGLEP